jgi:hypothetical protein
MVLQDRNLLCIVSTVQFQTVTNRYFVIEVFEAGRDSMRAFQKWRLQGPRLERAAILGRKRGREVPMWT